MLASFRRMRESEARQGDAKRGKMRLELGKVVLAFTRVDIKNLLVTLEKW